MYRVTFTCDRCRQEKTNETLAFPQGNARTVVVGVIQVGSICEECAKIAETDALKFFGGFPPSTEA